MPIDPEYPRERIDYMLKDSSVGVLVTTPKLQVKVKAEIEENSRQPWLPLQFIHIHTNPAFASEPSLSTLTSTSTCQIGSANLAYIIYTSGSTGRPKGVMVKKEGFLNLLRWYIEEFGFGKEDNNLLIAPISFDLSQKNLFSPFLTGGRLTLASPGIPDYRELAATIQEKFVTIINCAPSVFYPLMESNNNADFTGLQSLRVVILGGEPILPDRLLPWVNSGSFHCEIINTYGPTECTDIAAYHRISRETFLQQKEIPLGKPIPNAKVYILDKYLQVLPVRIPGELCIGGTGLSRGYSNNIYLTQEKFITAPHLPTKRVYRTGDLTRWLPDGNIQFLGRIDQQVKIRGARIELEEIESRLLKHEKIKEAVVTSNPGETGDNY
jgi:amino acid adenylation domain-containing protein